MYNIYDTHKVCDFCTKCLRYDECKDKGCLRYCMKDSNCLNVCGTFKGDSEKYELNPYALCHLYEGEKNNG